MNTEELILSGFCKTKNLTNTVIIEVEPGENVNEIVYANCKFKKCEHFTVCEIMKNAAGYELK